MSQVQDTPATKNKVPTGKAVHRKSRVRVPRIGISPSTKKLLETNEQIVSGYKGTRRKTLREIIASEK